MQLTSWPAMLPGPSSALWPIQPIILGRWRKKYKLQKITKGPPQILCATCVQSTTNSRICWGVGRVCFTVFIFLELDQSIEVIFKATRRDRVRIFALFEMPHPDSGAS